MYCYSDKYVPQFRHVGITGCRNCGTVRYSDTSIARWFKKSNNPSSKGDPKMSVLNGFKRVSPRFQRMLDDRITSFLAKSISGKENSIWKIFDLILTHFLNFLFCFYILVGSQAKYKYISKVLFFNNSFLSF